MGGATPGAVVAHDVVTLRVGQAAHSRRCNRYRVSDQAPHAVRRSARMQRAIDPGFFVVHGHSSVMGRT
ncbi:hypothetical protein [Nitrosomonas eutropha]|uniref:hypothetical protein n=1 Tax=Nitrosomonas eutropha TaxID=916 RepID=UPI0015A50C0D|nr:hypothetical protein [Nitrosomonas eutropha]